jgi:hypothetical protein
MGQDTGHRDDLAASALSFKLRIREPGKRAYSFDYGPYQSLTFAAFDAGQAVGIFQGRGIPTAWIEVEWYCGGNKIEATKDDSNGGREEEPTQEDPG